MAYFFVRGVGFLVLFSEINNEYMQKNYRQLPRKKQPIIVANCRMLFRVLNPPLPNLPTKTILNLRGKLAIR